MKPAVYSQLYIHLVFAVKNRDAILTGDIRIELFSYISGILTNKKQKSIIINGFSDYVHIFFGMNTTMSISDIVADLKRSSALLANEKKWFKGKFQWQEGYGAFSYSKSQIENVFNYIQNQEEHHKKRTFKEEYLDLLNKFEVEYDDRFLFEFFE